MTTIIRGGTVVTESATFVADLKMDGERIVAIGSDLEVLDGDEVVSAQGLFLLPGGIDVHTHLDMPVGEDISTCDDFYTGHRAAMPLARGAVHSADIEYAMGNLATNEVYAWTEEDEQVSDMMQSYYANFIKNGDPNGPGLPVWPQADEGEEVPYMVWDVQPRVCVDRHRERYAFHDQFFNQ